MSLVKKELTEKNQYEIEFQVDAAAFEAAVDRAYKKNVKKIRIDGFRPGKAPRHIVERVYGKEVFYNDAIDDVLPGAYEAAVKEAELAPVGQPEIEVVTIENGVTFKAKVGVKPVLTLDGYLGLKAERKVKRVLKKDIDEELERVQKRNARTIEVTD
ncbi:MAG: trigger factor family protein, partial [Eubacteriales bacterium]